MRAVRELIERDAEQAALEAAATDVLDGRGRVVIVEGEAGIGKTRLLGTVREQAGLRVLTARGSELESQFAFGVVGQLFEPVLRSASAAERRRWLAGAAAQAGHRLFDPAPDSGPTTASELAVLHSLYWLTANLCEQPAAMLVDDLHWADIASLRYLAYLQPRLESLPLLVVAAVRTGEPAADDLLLTRLASAAGVLTIRPTPLSEQATGRLLAAEFGRDCEPEFVAGSHRATGGNPLFVCAVAGALREREVAPLGRNADQVLSLGPQAVASWVSLRMAGVGRQTLVVARALAVLGSGTSVSTIRELTGLDALAVAESLAVLVRMGLVEADADRAGFTHPLVAAAVYGTIGVRDLAAAHERAADVLDRCGAPAEQVGGHLLKVPAGEAPARVGWLRRAAASALDRGSAEAAYSFLTRCLQEPLDPATRLEVLTQAAAVAIQVDLSRAIVLLEEARQLTSDPAGRAELGLQLGVAHGFLLDADRAFAALTAARDEVPADQEGLRRRLEATLLVGVFLAPGRTEIAERVPELAALPSHDSLGARMLAAMAGAHEMARCDPAGAERARAALADGELVRSANGEGALVCGWLTLLAADDPAALSSLDQAVTAAHHHGSVRALAAAYCFRAAGRLWGGQLADAESDTRAALELAETGRVDMDPSFAAAYLAEALAHRGELDEAEAALRSVGMPYADPESRPCYYALDAWSRLLCLRGRYAEGLAAARLAGRVWQSFGLDNPALGYWRSVAGLAAYELGDRALAAELLGAELDLARRWGAPRALGRALRNLGVVTDDPSLLTEAVAVLEDSQARLERAAALFDLGSAVRRSGRRTYARELLTRSLDEAELCGAGPLAERALAELRVAGFRPRRHRQTGPAALTASERRVAELAAAGATNREIAQSLFVTVKTVELHLSQAYRKLGIARRTELAEHLHVRTR